MDELERVLPDEGPAAPPRSNGELVFAEPWQSRIFGLTLALYAADRFGWPEFQGRLIGAIAVHERRAGPGDFDYWACWLEAFRDLGRSKGWLDDRALAALEAELAARPAGHDH